MCEIIFAGMLLSINSTFNIVIYSYKLPAFRRELFQLFRAQEVEVTSVKGLTNNAVK
jgi:hypothetical protein